MLTRMMVSAKDARRRPSISPSPFGDFLRGVMAAHGHESVADLVRLLEIEQSSVSRWLQGVSEPSLDNLRKIAGKLGTNLGELLAAAGVASREELGIAGGRARRMAPVLNDIQNFVEDKSTSDRQGQFVLKTARGVLNMAIESRDGVQHEPSHSDRQKRRS